MKTTLDIDDTIMVALKREAARQGCNVSELVETALRRFLHAPLLEVRKLQPLPRFASGGARVDVADRDALDDAMDRR